MQMNVSLPKDPDCDHSEACFCELSTFPVVLKGVRIGTGYIQKDGMARITLDSIAMEVEQRSIPFDSRIFDIKMDEPNIFIQPGETNGL